MKTFQKLPQRPFRNSVEIRYFFWMYCYLTTFVLLTYSSLALADDRQKSSDFGAETVEPDELYSEMTKPLPPHLVEDTAPLTKGKQKEEGSEKLPLGKSPKFKFPKTQEQLSEALSTEEDIVTEGGDGSQSSTFLNVKDADIATLVKTFSKITKRNFIVDSDVKGKITIHLPTAVTEEEALKIFDSVLLLKGFTTVPVGGNTWKVVAAKDAKSTTIPLVLDSPGKVSDTLVTQLIRMKYVPSEEMQKVLTQFISKDGIINSFTGTNSIIVIDSAANIKRLTALIKELDVPALDQDITIVPVKHAEADDIAEKISKILGEENDAAQGASGAGSTRPRPVNPSANTPTRPGMPPGSGQAAASSQTTVGTRSLPLKIIPDERTNSIIVVADKEMTDRVVALVQQLDSPLDLSSGRFHVYKLKHANAEEVAQILNALVSGGGSTYTPAQKSKGSSISRKERTKFGQSQNNQIQPTSYQPPQTQTPSYAGTGSSGQKGQSKGGLQSGRVTFEGDISIAPDPSTNSLIINASKGDFQKLSEVLEVLDSKRRQVLVEATILEVTLAKEEGMGIELQSSAGSESGGIVGQTNFGGLTNILTKPEALSDLTIAAASSGTLTLPGGLKIPSQAFLVSALSKISNVNVLSAPTIVTTDNEEAEIIVGENVPFVTGTSQNNSNLNNTFQQIERQDVGITLRITPQISTSDFVTLNIFVEISNVVSATRNDPNGPTTTVRTTETVVEVKNDQMIVTGGLIADSITDSTRGVPFLQDIPVLGEYFKRQDSQVRRTNLLIFITPRVITDQYEARDSTVIARNKLREEIQREQSLPDREDVLNSTNIDNVFEMEMEDQSKPTTSTPSMKQRARLLSPTATEEQKDSTKSTGSAYEVTISPNLPSDNLDSSSQSAVSQSGDTSVGGLQLKSVPTKSAIRLEQGNEPEESANQDNASKDNEFSAINDKKQSKTIETTKDKTFIVLRSVTGKQPDSLGLAVIGSPETTSGAFFQVGGQYKKEKGKSRQRYICLGKFSSQQEAMEQFPELKAKNKWQNLSLNESLNLGQNTWKQE